MGTPKLFVPGRVMNRSMLDGLNARIKIKKQSQGVIHVVLVARIFLLINIHLPKIKTKFRIYGLSDSYKQTVLIKSIIDDFLSKMDQNLIGKHK